MPEQIYEVAVRYKKEGRLERSLELHKYNVLTYPSYGEQYVMWSQAEVACAYTEMGDDTADLYLHN